MATMTTETDLDLDQALALIEERLDAAYRASAMTTQNRDLVVTIGYLRDVVVALIGRGRGVAPAPEDEPRYVLGIISKWLADLSRHHAGNAPYADLLDTVDHLRDVVVAPEERTRPAPLWIAAADVVGEE